jgi:hypothetical protein
MANDALVNLLDWCKDERSRLQSYLDKMQAGTSKTGDIVVGKGSVDTTPQTIETVRRSIAELDRLIADSKRGG